MSKQTEEKPLTISVVSKTESTIQLQVGGESNNITLTYTTVGELVILKIPHVYGKVLARKGRYEMLKHTVQSHFRGLRIETRTDADPKWIAAAKNRASSREMSTVGV